ncbi:Polyisoprenoid-binding protein YceI [Cyclobacterium lianum]|uniref:Polyisoprenoid-binding protein YceI n=1 Tax=Cyclobacterium lianum TaxID=388280 RepID=A0A1M7PVM5_9BACT|nr:YceI family protein [Cyclobacterium lianum]SHN21608.1 Polyisoprenoid-binding protein YceI [Cyclobacterium lianum]
MSWKRKWLIPLIYLLVVSRAGAQEFKTTAGEVEFLSQAALNEFTGKSDKLHGLIDFEQNLLDFYIDLNSLRTGIGLRDRHMRDNYLETDQYPFAEFTGKLSEKVNLEQNQSMEVMADGIFKIHGQEKEMEVRGTLTQVGRNEVLLEATFEVKLGDFDIAIPQVMFYELSEIQKVKINARLTR